MIKINTYSPPPLFFTFQNKATRSFKILPVANIIFGGGGSAGLDGQTGGLNLSAALILINNRAL